MTICEYNNCRVSAGFNLNGEPKAKYCSTHKVEGMVNVVDKMCETCNVRRAMYNYSGKTGGKYCISHKLENMINVKSKRCSHKDGDTICYTFPIYNFDGEQKGKYCIVHKLENMVNVIGKRCENRDCKLIAQFNIEGQQKGKYCSQHKDVGMIDIKHQKCEHDGCSLSPSYKLITDTRCRFCAIHKLEGMINGKHAICNFENCNILAGYNYIGTKTPIYCGEHKTETMVDLKHHLCAEPDCDKRPVFNIEGSKKGIYCIAHKKQDMINVISLVCKSEWCNNYANRNYDKYCINCFIHLFPDKPVSRNYKTKEKAVVDYIISTSDKSWICDKRVNDGCSKRRPDLFLDLGYQVIIVEIDENQHSDYDCSCENKRLMEISQDVGHRPIIFIRFNPDGYIDNNGCKIKTCWVPGKQTAILSVPKAKQIEWQHRLDSLKAQIDYWMVHKTNKTVEILQLFYDGTPT